MQALWCGERLKHRGITITSWSSTQQRPEARAAGKRAVDGFVVVSAAGTAYTARKAVRESRQRTSLAG